MKVKKENFWKFLLGINGLTKNVGRALMIISKIASAEIESKGHMQ
jgi:hypothetical protein